MILYAQRKENTAEIFKENGCDNKFTDDHNLWFPIQRVEGEVIRGCLPANR